MHIYIIMPEMSVYFLKKGHPLRKKTPVVNSLIYKEIDYQKHRKGVLNDSMNYSNLI